MSFVSYAQNLEDVMLWRALKHVENGFYIDVGANDPTVDSVTKAFYERSWHGINIEPLASHHNDLMQARPRDINLHCAAGAANGEIEVWECDVRGWATASSDVVAQHTAKGHAGAFHRVPVFQLTDICAQHVSGEIHFLKIDVEGFEKSVIDGMDFSRFRPWILIIEATRPNSTEEIHDEWEAGVLVAGYVLAYLDGLNRFYVAKEHSKLLDLLRYPPNVFDGFTRSEQLNSELRAQQAESRAVQAEEHAQQAESRAVQAEEHAQQAESRAVQAEEHAQQAESRAVQAEAASLHSAAQLEAVHNSSSWLITAPLRFLRKGLPKLKGVEADDASPRADSFSINTTGRLVLAHGIAYAKNSPRFRRLALRLLNRMPVIKLKLRQMHLKGQPSANWVGSSTLVDSRMPSLSNEASSASGNSLPIPGGVNAQQRTPLESFFIVYGSRN